MSFRSFSSFQNETKRGDKMAVNKVNGLAFHEDS